jgi:hypothetical protein
MAVEIDLTTWLAAELALNPERNAKLTVVASDNRDDDCSV